MAAIKSPTDLLLSALERVVRRSQARVFVHVSERLFERDPMDRALRLFETYKLSETPGRLGCLLYLNLRSRRYAIVADTGLHRALGQNYWDELSQNLRGDLVSTHFENALAMCVLSLSFTFERRFSLKDKSRS